MRPGRVNTYHNDPFVAAPANNAFVIALSRFLPVVCTTVVAGVVLTASLASHCFIPVFICPALLHRAVSISDPIYGDSRANDRFSLVNEYPFLVWEIVIFPFDGRSKITEWRASIPNFFILAKNFYYTTRYDPAFSRQEISKFGVLRDEMWYIKYDIKKIMEREGLRVTLLCVSSRWIANETGGSSKVVEQWDLEIYTLILLWRYVRTGGKKNKIETGRPLFPRPRILVKISRTTGDRHRKHSHTTTALVVPSWTTLSLKLDDSLGLKGYCKTTHSRPIPLFFQTCHVFFPSPSPSPFVRSTWCRHHMVIFLRKQICLRDRLDRRRQSSCIIQQYFISDPRYSFLSRVYTVRVHGDPVFVYLYMINILIEAWENIEVKCRVHLWIMKFLNLSASYNSLSNILDF